MPGPEIRPGVLALDDHGGGKHPRFALPADTGDMPRTVNWLARVLGFVWLGLLAFLIAPVHGPFAVPVQVAGYCLLGLGLVAWAVIDVHPATARDHAWVVSVVRGVIAVGAGVACAVGGGGTAIVAFGMRSMTGLVPPGTRPVRGIRPSVWNPGLTSGGTLFASVGSTGIETNAIRPT